jgi:hypothetical protein
VKVAILGCAVRAPGFPDWSTARRVMNGGAAYDRNAVRESPSPVPLPPNEQRRLPATAREALGVGAEALADARIDDARDIATVFSSCGSDGEITHQICEALARTPPQMSPTRFHNSVHNAPGGYWSIALRSHAPSTSLCAFEASFSSGLLEAAAQVSSEQRRVLLVAYDLPYPAPLSSLWNVSMPFCVAIVLAPHAAPHRGIGIELAGKRLESSWPAGVPAELRTNPAAASLPLLALFASGQPGRVVLPYPGDNAVLVTCE